MTQPFSLRGFGGGGAGGGGAGGGGGGGAGGAEAQPRFLLQDNPLEKLSPTQAFKACKSLPPSPMLTSLLAEIGKHPLLSGELKKELNTIFTLFDSDLHKQHFQQRYTYEIQACMPFIRAQWYVLGRLEDLEDTVESDECLQFLEELQQRIEPIITDYASRWGYRVPLQILPRHRVHQSCQRNYSELQLLLDKLLGLHNNRSETLTKIRLATIKEADNTLANRRKKMQIQQQQPPDIAQWELHHMESMELSMELAQQLRAAYDAMELEIIRDYLQSIFPSSVPRIRYYTETTLKGMLVNIRLKYSRTAFDLDFITYTLLPDIDKLYQEYYMSLEETVIRRPPPRDFRSGGKRRISDEEEEEEEF